MVLLRLKKLSVIIVNYNVCYFLEQALLAVRKAAARLDAEVLVVDNHSGDGSVEMVRRRFPEVTLICNSQNAGFSKANNQAIRQARGEYILLLNPDTVVEEETFVRCCRFMEEHPKAGALGVKMLDGQGNFLPESKRSLPTPEVAFYKIFGLATFFPKSKRFGRYHLSFLNPDQVHEVDVLSGAFMLLRRAALEQVGGLDEGFFMYGEDIDLSYRIQQAGYLNYYFPHTRILHYKGESTRKSSVNYVIVFYRAMLIFARKHFSANRTWLFSLLVYLAVFSRAGLALGARLLRYVRPHRLRRLSRTKLKRVAVVGSAEGTGKVRQVLRMAEVRATVVGWVSPELLAQRTEGLLGDLRQLDEIIRDHQLDELIFCGRDLSTTQIIALMVQVNDRAVEFKIMPEGSPYIIGSSSKNTPGDYYGPPPQPGLSL